MALLKVEQFQNDLRKGTLGSVYLFDGPETWLKEKSVQILIDKCLPPEARDFNLDYVDGDEVEGYRIISSAMSLPFLSEKRILIVKSAEKLSAADSKIVSESLSRMPSSTCLIFLYAGKASLKEELPAHVSSHGAIVTFWTPFENQRPGWICAQAKERGKFMTYDAAELLGTYCGNLQDISNELDKIILFAGKKKRIDLVDIRAYGLPDAPGDYKNLERAIWNRDFRETLRQTRLLFFFGIRAESIFPVFERIFRTLILGSFYVIEKKMPLKDVYATMRFRGSTQQNMFKRGLRAYSTWDLHRGMEAVANFDFEIKTGLLPPPIALSLLTLHIMRPTRV